MRKREVLKKILLVNTSARWCGVDVYCFRIRELFQNESQILFAAKKRSDFEKELVKNKAPHFSLNGNLLFEALLIREVLKRENPDIVHIQTARDYHLTLFKIFFPKIRFLITRHNSLALARFPNSFFFKKADQVVTVSNDSRQALLERFSDLATKTKTIYHGMEIPKKAPFPTHLTLQIGYLGRISETKGLHILIDALSLVRERFPRLPFQLRVGGVFESKAYEDRIRTSITDLALQEEIRFEGLIRDSAKFLKSVHLLVQPALLSARESFGLVVLEAMSVGRPVVAFACGALPELIRSGKTGLIAPQESSRSLAEALGRFAAKPGLLKTMGAAGHLRARRTFSLDAFRAKMAKLYQIA